MDVCNLPGLHNMPCIGMRTLRTLWTLWMQCMHCPDCPDCVQEKEEEKLREEFAKQGINIPVKDKSDVFDSNTITPGTPFMHRLSIALQYYIHCRLNSDPGWKGITVSLTSAHLWGRLPDACAHAKLLRSACTAAHVSKS